MLTGIRATVHELAAETVKDVRQSLVKCFEVTYEFDAGC